MGELGRFHLTAPKTYGPKELNYVKCGLVARQVERVDSGYRSTMSGQSSRIMEPINEFGSDALKQKYLPCLTKGERIPYWRFWRC
ncbi:acyl-CoA dehydrogenase family protein [Paraburkholderia sprentiae]|nr:acyl-CoA dehydrogenase family protein [Paraburkholderia sprentiae]